MRSIEISIENNGLNIPVGTIKEGADNRTIFRFEPSYIDMGPDRPILSLQWHSVTDDEKSVRRMRSLDGRVGGPGFLPPWFSGLLPEGALREMVEKELGPGRHGEIDLLRRLGRDLPGAVKAADDRGFANGLHQRIVDASGFLRFSLAGVQLKFSSVVNGDRLTLPTMDDVTPSIVKFAGNWNDVVHAEHAAMTMIREVGVDVAEHRIVPMRAGMRLPEEILRTGTHMFVSGRFDREGGRRVHMEDFAQILNAQGDRKYYASNYDSVVNMVRRFSSRPKDDTRQAVRRIVADMLVGNGDSHLKNWSFLIRGSRAELSPAYDVVPTTLIGDRTMALTLQGTRNVDTVDLAKLERMGSYVGMEPGEASSIAASVVDRALETWPTTALATERADEIRRDIVDSMRTLPLVAELRPGEVPRSGVRPSTSNERTS